MMVSIAAITLAALTAATILTGCGPAKENPNNAIADPMPILEEGELMINEELGEPMAKVMVNISGEVTEVSEDGTKIKVGDTWDIHSTAPSGRFFSALITSVTHLSTVPTFILLLCRSSAQCALLSA